MSEKALVVMARYPEPGKTKTRLARALGNEEVARLYRAFLTDLAQRFAGQAYDLYWAYTPAEVDYQSFIAGLAPQYARQMWSFPQEGEDFGARLHHAFRRLSEEGFQRVILIGSDSPHISREIIERADAALDEADVVLGPADDGGYYLLGMHKPYDVFSGIPMSTSVVARMTIEAAERQGLRVRLIDSLFDVDELPDLLRLTELLTADCTLAPATAAHLVSMRNLHDHSTCTHPTTLDLHRADQPL